MAFSRVLCAFLCLAWVTVSSAGQAKPTVVASFFPAQCLAHNIVGDKGQVELLLGNEEGPHHFQLTPAAIRQLKKADLLIVNGLGLESWLTKVSRELNCRVVKLSDGLTNELLKGFSHSHEDGHAHHEKKKPHKPAEQMNPHIWLDPTLMVAAVSNITRTLQEISPGHAADYARNAEALRSRLTKLDLELMAELQPVRSIPFLSLHDAFPYFVRRYGLTLGGVVHEVADGSPSARQLAALSAKVRKEKVKVIFTEPQFPQRVAKQLAKDLGLRVGALDTLETGSDPADGYEKAMRQNGRVLKETLSAGGPQ